MRTLYLHIGMMKTGTTAIQRFLLINEKKLLEQGLLFRRMPYYYEDAYRYRNGHFLCKHLYDKDGSYLKEQFWDRWYEGMELVASWFEECDSVVLTDEVIWNVLFRKKRNFLPKLVKFGKEHDFCVKVIVYLRSQDEFVDSLYRQWIRMGYTSNDWSSFVEEIKEKVCLDYETGLKKIEKSIGKDNLIVRRYESGMFQGTEYTIYEDFLKIVGLSMTENFEIPDEKDTNPSILPQFAEIKRKINRLIENKNVPRQDRANLLFKDAVNLCSVAGLYPQQYFMNDSERAIFMEQFHEENKKTAEKYFGETQLFHEKRNFQGWKKDCDEQLEALTYFVGGVVIEQQRQIGELSVRVKELESRRRGFQGLRKVYRFIKRKIIKTSE